MKFRRFVFLLALLGAVFSAGARPGSAQPVAQDGETLLVAGSNSLSKGEYRAAARQLTQAMRAGNLSTGQIAKALYLRGVAQRNMDKPAQAIADLTSALWLQGLSKGDLAQAYLNRGLAYQAVGMNDPARADQSRARELDPKARVAGAATTSEPGPSIGAFQTEVETARRAPSSKPVPDFTTQVARAPVKEAKPGPRIPASSFETEVRTAARDPEPVPAFRTSILPDEQAAKPASRPAPRPAQGQAVDPQWSTSVAADQTKQAGAKSEKPAKSGGLISGWWRSATGGGDEKEKQAEQKKSPPAATGQWSQTTQVTRSGPASQPGAPVTVPAPGAGGAGRSYRVQLAAVRSEDEAQSTWSRLSAKHGPLLAGREPLIERTDLGGLGIFYRIQIGPFADKKESAQLCNTFKRSGIDCFLVAR